MIEWDEWPFDWTRPAEGRGGGDNISPEQDTELRRRARAVEALPARMQAIYDAMCEESA